MSYFKSSLLPIVAASALLLTGCAARRVAPPQPPVAATVHNELQSKIALPYNELFDVASGLKFTPKDLQDMRKHLDETRAYCTQRAKDNATRFEKQVNAGLDELKHLPKDAGESQRHDLHCKVQDMRSSKAQMDMLAQHLVPTAFQNSDAKIELLEKWPADEQLIRQRISSGEYRQRRWANVEDIGFRKIEENQKDDIKRGEDAVRQLRQQSAMPREIENQQIRDYVSTVAQNLARNSDLEVPLKVVVLDSKEVNAFALPGGFLFVQRGLLEEADDEAQLAGVLAHEMAHVAARHSHRLYKKALASSIAFQAAQIAALIMTGGVSSIGSYYALQYGFYGLGFALELNLLGVSRDYELEADQLGIQYAWKSGYDPDGFIRFFDKMASKHGYAMGVSWFRTHPPFYDRMVRSKEEIKYLPPKEAWVVQTQQFEQMKRVLKDVSAKSNAEQDAKGPSLLGKEEKCEKPKQLYKSEDPIENICNSLPDSGS